MELIKDIFIRNGYDWRPFKGKPLAVLIIVLQQALKDGDIVLAEEDKQRADFSKVEKNLEEARKQGASKYLRGKGKTLTIRELPELKKITPPDEAYKDIAKEDRKFADLRTDAEKKRDSEEARGIINTRTSVDDIYGPGSVDDIYSKANKGDEEAQQVVEEIASDASDLINNTLDVGQGEELPTSLTEAVNLLRNYEQGKSLGFDEIKLLEGKVSNAFSNGDLSRGEFNAINNFLGNLPDIATTTDEVVVVETTEISNDWNTDGPNIILIDDKRYALFAKDGSFRSAGSELEFNSLLNGTNPDTQKPDPDWAGWKPIRNDDPIWINYAESEGLLDDVELLDDDSGVDTSTLGQNVTTEKNQFNNIPEGADLVDVDGKLYLKYAVPGAGSLYQGSTIFMFYEVKDNDPVKAGIVTDAQDWVVNSYLTDDDLDKMGVMAGNSADLPGNDPLGQPLHPFTSFAENLATEAQIAPWILDPDSVALIAEAALEGREVSVAEWAETNWYNKHTESERDWLREYYRDPLTAKQKANDYKLRIENAMEAAGISGGYDTETNQELGVPSALSSYIANKWVSGSWTESYASEQIGLFADPFKSGVRDSEFTTWIETAGVGGLNRTAEQEDRVRQIYTQWLGPVFGQLTDEEVAEKAGRMRNNPDYEAALIENLKTSRLALFPKYTNTELTYDDIASPWRGLTTSVWGQTADETQGWWQDMVAANDYEAGQTVLREKGLEQNVGQVTVAATQALQEALGAGAGGVEANLGVNQ